jgi:NitT/TauT family transport system permease protein
MADTKLTDSSNDVDGQAVVPASALGNGNGVKPWTAITQSKWFGYAMVPLVFIVAVSIWEAISRAGMVAAIILPAPSAIGKSLLELVTAPFFPKHVQATLYETVVGFLIAAVLGLFLGSIISQFPIMRTTLYPYIVAFQVLPKSALAPLFITWFGFGVASKVVMSAVIAFFVVTLNTMVGLESYAENEYLLMRSLQAKRWQIFTKLKVPSALPFVFAGFKNGITLALVGAVVGEFVAAQAGLGLLVEVYNFQMKIPLVFATIIVLSLMGLALYGIMELLDRKIVFWRTSSWEQDIL